jgi:hypothetical protein
LGKLGDELDPTEFSRGTLAFLAGAKTELPPVGAMAIAGGSLAVVLHGDVVCRITQSGEQTAHSGRDAGLALNEVVRGPYTRASLSPAATRLDEVRLRYDLKAGLVPAGAVVIVPWSDAASDHAAAVEGSGAGASDPSESGELVDGIACPAGHFNHPFALECETCGVSLLESPRTTVWGLRAPLGRLTFDDGVSYPLDRNYVLGRNPDHDPAIVAGDASPLRLEDPQDQISRVHAEVRSVGWDVQIIDRGSGNGTHVLPPEGKAWQRLDTDEPRPISPGTRVSMGRRIMTYDL